MPLNFPDNPSDGDIFQGYVYDDAREVWDVKLIADQNLEDLDNVNIVTPTDGQALIYDTTNTEWIAGDVASGPAPAKIIASNSIAVDFSDGIELETRTVTGNVTFTGSNYTSGVKKTIYLDGDTVQRSLTFPNEWTFITDKPTAIGANKNNILDLNSFGTSASTTVGIWLGQSSFEPIVASGGVETEIIVDEITYKVHTFTSSSFLNITSLGSAPSVEYLIVAGGGGGGTGNANGNEAGGGGAGGLLYGVTSPSASNFTVTIGGGGSANSNGTNSSIFGLTSIGGGAGGTSPGAGQSGGSGGGGAHNITSGGARTLGQGNVGGTPSGSSSGGGGGGAGAAGQGGNTSTSTPANGGNGSLVGISGTAIYYAGGGAGAVPSVSSSGGLGGGASKTAGSGNGSNGLANTGGGASGGNGGSAPGGIGGSGIVIIRYPITDPN